MKEELKANAPYIWEAAVVRNRFGLWIHGGSRDVIYHDLQSAVNACMAVEKGVEAWALCAELPIEHCAGICFVVGCEQGEFWLGAIGHGSAELFGAPSNKTFHDVHWESVNGRAVFKLLADHGWNLNYHGR